MVEQRTTYEPTDQEVALRAWVRTVLSGWDTVLHEVDVSYTRQLGPRAKPPCATLYVVAEVPNGEPYRDTTDTPLGSGYEARIIQHYTGTVEVSVYGPAHTLMARALVRSIERDDVREALKVTGVNVTDVVDGPNDITDLLDTAWEGRSQVDFAFSFAECETFEAEVIEKIRATFRGERPDGVEITSLTSVG